MCRFSYSWGYQPTQPNSVNQEEMVITQKWFPKAINQVVCTNSVSGVTDPAVGSLSYLCAGLHSVCRSPQCVSPALFQNHFVFPTPPRLLSLLLLLLPGIRFSRNTAGKKNSRTDQISQASSGFVKRNRIILSLEGDGEQAPRRAAAQRNKEA